jgi:7 transmembrane sweet-taste receptor of 3 GCPR
MVVLDPVKYTIRVVTVDEFERPVESYGKCDWVGSIEFLAPLCCVNFVVLILAVVEAYRARNLSTEFAESTYIFLALISTLLVVFIGVPVLVISADNPDASVFVSSAIIFVASTSILCLIFVPKYKYEKDRQRNQSKSKVVKVSGLDFVPGGSDLMSRQFSDFSTGPEEGKGVVNGGVDDEAGERILTTKTRQELAMENERLKRHLNHARERIAALTNEAKDAWEVQALTGDGSRAADSPVDTNENNQHHTKATSNATHAS